MHLTNIFAVFFILWCVGAIMDNTKQVVLKLADSNPAQYLGKDNERILKPVDYENAIKFELRNMEDVTQKVLKDPQDNSALTRRRQFWIGRRYFKFKPVEDDEPQSFRLVYYGPNNYVLMNEDYCLGLEDGKFRSKNCTDGKNVTHFRICLSEEMCEEPMNLFIRMYKDIRMLKRRLIGPVYGNGMRSKRRRNKRRHKKRRRMPRNMNMMNDYISRCYGYGGG